MVAARVAWITTDLAELGARDRDIDPVTAASAELGVELEPVRWRESDDVDWSVFDLAVIRSPWDYPDHLDTFLDWLAEAERRLPVSNDPEVVRWNLDKAYLQEMADAGIPVVDTVFCGTPGQVGAALRAVGRAGHGRAVVKPDISAGSRDTGLFAVDDSGAVELAEEILTSGRRVLVQPEVVSVATAGERGLVMIDGVFCHAIRKGPILAEGGGLRGGAYTEDVTVVDATAEEIALAERVVAACTGPVPLYARIDLVATPAGPALSEAELFEPSLFCDLAPVGAARFAAAIAGHIDRLDRQRVCR